MYTFDKKLSMKDKNHTGVYVEGLVETLASSFTLSYYYVMMF